MMTPEIFEKVEKLKAHLLRIADLAGGQEVHLAASSGRAQQQGALERRGAPSSSPLEALHAVGNALRAIGVALEGAQGEARQAQPGAAAAPFQVARGHTGTVPPGGQASAAAAPSKDLGIHASKPIWETVGHTVPRVDRPEWQELLASLPIVEERERDEVMDARILRGWEVLEANLQLPKRVVRFLVSSTFTVRRPSMHFHVDLMLR
ncbi:hypothetical protein T484DRAFT_3133253 [Baffinella frigidus]|nr:hypothetical protein T484DRAFT_3133253 [Cryptophyta sp. CCMP2293]